MGKCLSATLSQLSSYSTENLHVFQQPTRLGAFNVRRFGREKMKDKKVVDLLVKIVTRYDILLLQEIVDSTGKALENLLELVNAKCCQANKYDMAVSPRLGRSSSKEQYAYLYKKGKFAVKKCMVYPDPGDVFIREPFVVQFNTDCSLLEKENELVLVGVHTQPANAPTEVDALFVVWKWTKKTFKTDNIIILGDLNGGYVNDWSRVRIRSDSNFYWLLPDHADTTATKTNAAHDRIVACGKRALAMVAPGSATAFRYDEHMNVSKDMLLKVSDHYPVEVLLLPFAHPTALNNVVAREALVLEDSRPRIVSLPLLEVPKGLTLSSFRDEKGDLAVLRYIGVFATREKVLVAATRLREMLPELMSYSLLASLGFHVREEASEFRLKVELVESRCVVTVEFGK